MKETEKRIGTRRLMNISARIKTENYGAEKGLCRGNSWKRTCRGFRFTKKRGNRRSVSGTVSTPVLRYFLVWSRCRPTFFLMAYLLPDVSSSSVRLFRLPFPRWEQILYMRKRNSDHIFDSGAPGVNRQRWFY